MKKIVLFSLIFLVFISVSAVSAAENATDVVSDGDDYNAEIIADDYTAHYQSDNQLVFDIYSYDGVEDNERFDMIDNKTGKVIGMARYIDGEGYGFVDADVGSYKVTIKQWEGGSSYKIKPIMINVKITQAPVKLIAYKWISTTKQYATLKVLVRDKEYNCPIEEGIVKFVIGGKTYAVKVKDGVATKKIKLTKAGIYSYKALFSSKNYKYDSVSSKVYVKKVKSYYTFKAGKYKVKISYNKYVKLINDKNNGRDGYLSIKIGKYKNKYPMEFIIESLPKDGLVKKGDYLTVWASTPVDMGTTLVFKKVDLNTLNP